MKHSQHETHWLGFLVSSREQYCPMEKGSHVHYGGFSNSHILTPKETGEINSNEHMQCRYVCIFACVSIHEICLAHEYACPSGNPRLRSGIIMNGLLPCSMRQGHSETQSLSIESV